MASSSSSSPSSSTSSSPPFYKYSSNIIHMDQDHLISILHLLPLDSIISFSRTCRRFRSVASSDALWKEICRRDWGSGVVDALASSFSFHDRREFSWKRLYQRVSQAGSLSCRRLVTKDGISPRPRASHSLNFISDCLVLFGGGCEGGRGGCSDSRGRGRGGRPRPQCSFCGKDGHLEATCYRKHGRPPRRHLDDTWVAHVGSGFNRVLSWKQVGSGTPSGRFGHTCTILGKTLVLFGGINDDGVRQNDTWIGQVINEGSSVTKISWRLLDVEAIFPPPRGAHAACGIGELQLMIHGGIGPYGHRLNDTWILDLSEGPSMRWHQLANTRPSPPARSGHSITCIGEKNILLFGGRGAGYEVLNDLWILETGGDCPKWNELKCDSSNLQEMPLPRVGHSATTILGGNILIHGGEDSQRHRKDDFWMLDVGSLSRFQATDLKKYSKRMWKNLRVEGHCPGCRSFHGACTDLAGFRIFVFGGMIDSVVHPTEAFGLRFDGGLHLVELVIYEPRRMDLGEAKAYLGEVMAWLLKLRTHFVFNAAHRLQNVSDYDIAEGAAGGAKMSVLNWRGEAGIEAEPEQWLFLLAAGADAVFAATGNLISRLAAMFAPNAA
ncbi:F-box/kelch-repeat protein [Platanthera zijinensis]|uniref:F-box/kelch-repeat protein n=1 Tax=Platanthera zijinensis TaxID=2320716 RepID=A0AAP0ASI6_9ASPA